MHLPDKYRDKLCGTIATSKAVAQTNATQSAKDRAAAHASAQQSNQDRDASEVARESISQLNAGNVDRAILLARTLVPTTTQPLPLFSDRVIRQIVQSTPSYKVLKDHADLVNAVAWSPNGKYFITASSDKTTIVWDAITYRAIGKLEGHTE